MSWEDIEDPRLPGPGGYMQASYGGRHWSIIRTDHGEWTLGACACKDLQDAARFVANQLGIKRVHPWRVWPQINRSIEMTKEITTRFENSKCRICQTRLPKGTKVQWEHKNGVTCMPCAAKGPESRSGKPGEDGTPVPGVPGESGEGDQGGEASEATPEKEQESKPTEQESEAKPPSDAAKALRNLIGLDEALEQAASKGAKAAVKEFDKLLEKGLEQIDRPKTVRIELPERSIEPDLGEVQHPKFEQLARWIACGVNRIWITGEAGTGKTYAAEKIAKALGYPLHIASPGATEYDHLGYRDAHGNYQDTAFFRWAADENPFAILLLDEIDRNAVNALQALNSGLANGIAAFPHRQMTIDIRKIVVGTANTMGEGPSLRYVGCLAQDGSVIDRFAATMHWELHEPTERAIALKNFPYDTTPKAIDASVKVRRNLESIKSDLGWGPRRTYAVAQLMGAKENARDACLAAGLSRLASADQDIALRGVK